MITFIVGALELVQHEAGSDINWFKGEIIEKAFELNMFRCSTCAQ